MGGPGSGQGIDTTVDFYKVVFDDTTKKFYAVGNNADHPNIYNPDGTILDRLLI